MKKRKKLISPIIVETILLKIYSFQSFFYWLFHAKKAKRVRGESKILYLMTPTHSNIGDAAIALGAFDLFKKSFPKKNIIEFTDVECQKKLFYLKRIISKNDVVMLHGGGNLGDWYPAWELLREQLLKIARIARVILLPQTISFDNTKYSKAILKKAEKYYSKYPPSLFLCRDKKSFVFATKHFKNNNLKVAPDTALILNRTGANDKQPMIALLCLRNDIEKNRTKEFDKHIKKVCEEVGFNILTTDTIFNTGIQPKQREQIVNDKIHFFKQAGIVVTDRYHGVIFSYLAQVPCVVLANKDSKVEESMAFFNSLGYIKFCSNIDSFATIFHSLIGADTSQNEDFYERFFSGLIKDENQ